jgi:hypothetical protein
MVPVGEDVMGAGVRMLWAGMARSQGRLGADAMGGQG